jgi:hypothetical protein
MLEDQKEAVKELRVKVARQMERNKKLGGLVKELRKREIEIVKRWDLDDIDLVTERLNMFRSHESKSKPSGREVKILFVETKKPKSRKKKHPKIPKLDFTRVYEIQQEQNEDYEEEEEEDEEEYSHNGYGKTSPHKFS